MQSSFSYEASLRYDHTPRDIIMAIEPTRKRNKILGAEKGLGMRLRNLVQGQRTALSTVKAMVIQYYLRNKYLGKPCGRLQNGCARWSHLIVWLQTRYIYSSNYII